MQNQTDGHVSQIGQINITCNGVLLEQVNTLTYLGSVSSDMAERIKGIKTRLAIVRSALSCFSVQLKHRLTKALIWLSQCTEVKLDIENGRLKTVRSI